MSGSQPQIPLGGGSAPGAPNLNDVQGDIILGLMKRTQIFTFFNIVDPVAFKSALKAKVAPLITTHNDVLADQKKADEANKNSPGGQKKVWLPIVQTNIAFSASGLKKLLKDPKDVPQDAAFINGQVNDAKEFLDDPLGADGELATWSDAFLHADIDGVLNVTAPNSLLLDARLDGILKDLGHSIRVVTEIQGRARPGANEGHEHFGFKDGVSVPLVAGINENEKAKKGTQDVIDKNLVLLGPYGRVVPQGPDALPGAGKPAPADPKWAQDGSYMVFRKLQQKVAEFHHQSQILATNLQQQGNKDITAGLIEARMVGRWPSGAPLVLSAKADDPVLGANPLKNNEFDFANDKKQALCPYVAHIRKTNPRAGIDVIPREGGIKPRLMVRQGIPYGSELERKERKSGRSEQDRGLLFVCYQSSITAQFRFVQKFWANESNFPPNPFKGVSAGQDPIIGLDKAGAEFTAQNIVPKGPAGDADEKNEVRFSPFVLPTGGEYFFAPPKSALLPNGRLVV